MMTTMETSTMTGESKNEQIPEFQLIYRKSVSGDASHHVYGLDKTWSKIGIS